MGKFHGRPGCLEPAASPDTLRRMRTGEEVFVAENDKSTSGTKTSLAKRSSSKKKASRKKAAAKRKTKKKVARKTAKRRTKKAKGKPKKKTAKKSNGPGRTPNEWTLVSLAEILAYKAVTGLTDKQLAKQFGVSSIARMKKGDAPVQETQERIRKIIAGKDVVADRLAATPSAGRPSRSRKKSKAIASPSEGLALLMRAILDEDWDLARAAYDKLK